MIIKIIASLDEGEGGIEHLIGQTFETSKEYPSLEDGTVYIETYEGLYPVKPKEYKVLN